MAVVEREIMIQAGPELIDQYATDPAHVPNWFEGVVEASTEKGYPQVGGVLHLKYQTTGISFELTATSTEYDHTNSMTMQMEGMISGTQRWDMIPQDGGTLVRVTFDYAIAGGGLGAIADKLIVEKVNTSNLEKSLAKLKTLVESA